MCFLLVSHRIDVSFLVTAIVVSIIPDYYHTFDMYVFRMLMAVVKLFEAKQQNVLFQVVINFTFSLCSDGFIGQKNALALTCKTEI